MLISCVGNTVDLRLDSTKASISDRSQRILHISHFPDIAGAIVNFLLALVPAIILYDIIKLVMRFPEHAARTAADFLKNPVGLRQAL